MRMTMKKQATRFAIVAATSAKERRDGYVTYSVLRIFLTCVSHDTNHE